MNTVTLLTKENFNTFINNEELTLVDFWAPWCGPCRALAPILEKIATEKSVKIGKMSIEDEDAQPWVEAFQIRSIPTLLFFKNGKCIEVHTGMISEQDLWAKIKNHLNK